MSKIFWKLFFDWSWSVKSVKLFTYSTFLFPIPFDYSSADFYFRSSYFKFHSHALGILPWINIAPIFSTHDHDHDSSMSWPKKAQTITTKTEVCLQTKRTVLNSFHHGSRWHSPKQNDFRPMTLNTTQIAHGQKWRQQVGAGPIVKWTKVSIGLQDQLCFCAIDIGGGSCSTRPRTPVRLSPVVIANGTGWYRTDLDC